MIILITSEINIVDSQFNLTSWSLFIIVKDKRNKIKHISHVGLSLFTDICLKSYLRSTVGQTRLSSIAIIYLGRFYANRIRTIELLIFLEKEKLVNP